MEKILIIIIGNIFINNFILFKFLGLCPFLGVSKQTKPALSMGIAVMFVMVTSTVITWLLYNHVLVPLNIAFLRTIFFILVIATAVQLIEMFIMKTSPLLYRALGIYLPLITTNCAILGVAVLNINDKLSLPLAALQALCAGLGFTLALLLMSGIRERLELSGVPESLKGIPIAFIVASLMSLAFMGFMGFKI